MFSSDTNVSILHGASPFEEFEEVFRALLRATPGLSAQQKKDLVYCNLGRDVMRELSCQQEKATTSPGLEGDLWRLSPNQNAGPGVLGVQAGRLRNPEAL